MLLISQKLLAETSYKQCGVGMTMWQWHSPSVAENKHNPWSNLCPFIFFNSPPHNTYCTYLFPTDMLNSAFSRTRQTFLLRA